MEGVSLVFLFTIQLILNFILMNNGLQDLKSMESIIHHI